MSRLPCASERPRFAKLKSGRAPGSGLDRRTDPKHGEDRRTAEYSRNAKASKATSTHFRARRPLRRAYRTFEPLVAAPVRRGAPTRLAC
jgi:hypothetical protein